MKKIFNLIILSKTEARKMNEKYKNLMNELNNLKKNNNNKKSHISNGENKIILYFLFFIDNIHKEIKNLKRKQKKLEIQNNLLKKEVNRLSKELDKQKDINIKIYEIIKEQDKIIQNLKKNLDK